MTTSEKKTKSEALIEKYNAVLNEAKERIEEFVNDALGSEFQALRITSQGFDVALMRNGADVFGCSFEVRIRDDWYSDKNDKKAAKVKMNIGTCGEFEIGTSDDQEKKYMAFARIMETLQEWGMVNYLLHFHELARSIEREMYKLDIL